MTNMEQKYSLPSVNIFELLGLTYDRFTHVSKFRASWPSCTIFNRNKQCDMSLELPHRVVVMIAPDTMYVQ